MVGIGLFAFTLFGTLSLFVTGLKSYNKTTNDLNMTQPNAQAIRHMCENLRQAMSISLSNNGNTINFTLPAMTGSTDPVTGEKEFQVPLVSDGTSRSYAVTNGNLVENPGGRILLKGISTIDPDPSSALYKQTYQPFVISMAGTREAVTLNLITSCIVNTKTRFSKMKTTVVLQNIR
jgi:hypothetical protein